LRKHEQTLGAVILGSFCVIALADTLRHLLGYLIVLAALLIVVRLLLGDRFSGGR
jgi:hypothetical protein